NAGEVDGGPHAAVDLLDGCIMVLQRADANLLTGGHPLDLVADAGAAGDHRDGDDGAVALDDEGAVDRHAEPGGAAAFLDLPAAVGDPRLEMFDPLPGHGRRGHDGGVGEEAAGDEVADFQLDDVAGVLIDEVAHGQGDDAVAQPEQAEDLEVLAGL